MYDPITQARIILEHHWDNELPVRVDKIAKNLGVSVLKMADPSNGLSGAYDPNHSATNGPTILVNPSESANRRRFTIAHELGHHLLHGKKRFRDPINQAPGLDPVEVEANAFAAALVMPASAIRVLFEGGAYSIKGMSEIFGVSQDAMHWRLKNMGYA